MPELIFATQEDIINLYGLDELLIVADKPRLGVPDQVVVTSGLQAASREITPYIMVRYPAPTAGQLQALIQPCVDIALYRMSTGTAITEEKRKRYEDALRFLTKIAEGKLPLESQDSVAAPENQGHASFVSSPRQFSRNSLKGF